jgi:hypothetical protein
MQQVLTFDSFLNRVNSLDNIQDAYDVFEYECTDVVRDHVLSFADVDSVEPFRNIVTSRIRKQRLIDKIELACIIISAA